MGAGIGGTTEMGAGLGGSVGDALGSLIGEALAQGDYATAEKLMQQAAHAYDGMQGPNVHLGPSAMEGVAPNQMARSAREQALQKLMGIGLEGGMDPESRAAVEQAKMEAAGYEQAQRGAIMQHAQATGNTSNNLNQAQALIAQQGGANRVGMMGIQAAGDARSRALNALSGAGEMAGSLERDDYGQQKDLALSRDAIAEFNERNKQQAFENQLGIKDRQTQGALDEAGMYDERGNRKVRQARGIGKGVGTIAGGVGGAAAGSGLF